MFENPKNRKFLLNKNAQNVEELSSCIITNKNFSGRTIESLFSIIFIKALDLKEVTE